MPSGGWDPIWGPDNPPKLSPSPRPPPQVEGPEAAAAAGATPRRPPAGAAAGAAGAHPCPNWSAGRRGSLGGVGGGNFQALGSPWKLGGGCPWMPTSPCGGSRGFAGGGGGGTGGSGSAGRRENGVWGGGVLDTWVPQGGILDTWVPWGGVVCRDGVLQGHPHPLFLFPRGSGGAPPPGWGGGGGLIPAAWVPFLFPSPRAGRTGAGGGVPREGTGGRQQQPLLPGA